MWEKGGGGGGLLSSMKSGILMMMCCCRLSLLPHCDDVIGVVWTCLPVATLSLCLVCTLSGTDCRTRRRIQMSSRAAGPCPMQGPCGQRWKIIPCTRTTEVSLVSLLLWTEIWEADRNARGLGHGWAQNRSQCVDRSVQLVLIPVHAYNCFCYLLRATYSMWCVVKDECWRKIPMCEVSPWTLLFIVLI